LFTIVKASKIRSSIGYMGVKEEIPSCFGGIPKEKEVKCEKKEKKGLKKNFLKSC